MRNVKKASGRYLVVALLGGLAVLGGCNDGERSRSEETRRRFLAILGGDPIVQAVLESASEMRGEGGIVASNGRYFFSPDEFRLVSVMVLPQASRFEFPKGPAIPCAPPGRPIQPYTVQLKENAQLPDHLRDAFPSQHFTEILVTGPPAAPVAPGGGAVIHPAAWGRSAGLEGPPVTMRGAAFLQPGDWAAACTDLGFGVVEYEYFELLNFGDREENEVCSVEDQCATGLTCQCVNPPNCQEKRCKPWTLLGTN